MSIIGCLGEDGNKEFIEDSGSNWYGWYDRFVMWLGDFDSI